MVSCYTPPLVFPARSSLSINSAPAPVMTDSVVPNRAIHVASHLPSIVSVGDFPRRRKCLPIRPPCPSSTSEVARNRAVQWLLMPAGLAARCCAAYEDHFTDAVRSTERGDLGDPIWGLGLNFHLKLRLGLRGPSTIHRADFNQENQGRKYALQLLAGGKAYSLLRHCPSN